MLKKNVCIVCISLVFVPLLSIDISADWIDIYKSGVTALIPDSRFGKETDWDDPAIYKLSSLAISGDGKIFAAVSKQHKIFKFDSTGRMLSSFGQKGQGPSDLISPGDLTVLDNRYLVVCDYALNRKISIFDLSGKFLKVIRTTYPVYGAVSLKNSKIAILTNSYQLKTCTTAIFIKDIFNDKEKKIAERVEDLRIVDTANNVLIDQTLQGEAFLRKTTEGNLLLGFSYDKSIKIFSPEGIMIKSFDLKAETVKIDNAVIESYKKSRIESIKKNFRKPDKPLKNFLGASNRLRKLFFDYLPFYSTIFVDEHNYILVFDFSFSYQENIFTFKVYSADGDYICDSGFNFTPLNCTLKPGDLKNSVLTFHEDAFFFILDEKSGDDIQRKIVKTTIQTSQNIKKEE